MLGHARPAGVRRGSLPRDTLYRCLDRVLPHKDALFQFQRTRWANLFSASFDVLLYDLTSTYFESDPPFPEGDKRRFGYSRDHRPDRVQVVVALVVMPGNTADCTTLHAFLDKVGGLYPDFPYSTVSLAFLMQEN